MGAGQIGGFATLLDIDFENAAGFVGQRATDAEGQFVVYYLSHALLFCVGALIESHVVVSPASCVYGERQRFHVYGGSHRFTDLSTTRTVENLCIHRSYNHSLRYSNTDCSIDNVALLILGRQFSLRQRENGSEYVINRVRYGFPRQFVQTPDVQKCSYFGWGSRRNGFLVPLLLFMFKVDVNVLACDRCHQMWNPGNMYVCVEEPSCKSENYGALSPDDLGSPLVCQGFIRGIMTSNLIDRPAGVGFLDLIKYHKFLTCGVDGARDVTHNVNVHLLQMGPHQRPRLFKQHDEQEDLRPDYKNQISDGVITFKNITDHGEVMIQK